MTSIAIETKRTLSQLLSEKNSDTFQIIFASLFLALCAQISIPLPFTPIPLTGQSFGVMLIGALLGGKKGAAATLLYLAEGALGCPVWALGHGGFTTLIGTSGGYLFAFPLLAYLSGELYARCTSGKILAMATAAALPCMIHLSLGSLWLAAFVGSSKALALGFTPFIPGELLKGCLVLCALSKRAG